MDRITICLSTVVVAFGTLTHASQAGRVIDMRQCPLDAVTFIDPVAGAEFTVTRVGTNRHYLCAAGPTDIPPADEQCSGPFGDLVLQGNDSEPDAPGRRKIFAVWSVTKAAPCCGWSVLDEVSGQELTREDAFRWLGKGETPLLGDTGFASIQFDEAHRNGIAMFSAPRYAMKCEIDLGSREPGK